MRRLVSRSSAWLLAVMLAWTTGTAISWARASRRGRFAEADSDDRGSGVRRARRGAREGARPRTPAQLGGRHRDLSRGRRCAGPAATEFSRRLRLCELHFKLIRRYQDASFRGVLLRLPREQAIDLYDEVLERIQTHYVDPVPLEPLVRHGLDNLEVALRDPVFVRTNVGDRGSRARRVAPRPAPRPCAASSRCPTGPRPSSVALSACGARPPGDRDRRRPPVLLEFTCGACDALDDFTSYLTPDKLEDLYAMIDGNFVGLGIELKSDPRACGWSA